MKIKSRHRSKGPMTGCLGNHQRQEQTVAKIQHGSLYRERGKKKKKSLELWPMVGEIVRTQHTSRKNARKKDLDM